MPAVRAHGESGSFAVCLPSWHTANLGALPCACRPGTQRIWELCRVATVRAHGESESVVVCLPSGHTANSRRRHQLAVTASARFFSSCAYIYTRRKGLPCARLLAHGKQGLCHPVAAVRALPSAIVDEVFAVCLCVFAVCLGHTANSGLRL